MKTWMYSDKLKKQALIKLAYRLPEADTAELRATFDSLDTEKLVRQRLNRSSLVCSPPTGRLVDPNWPKIR
jgi:hypothetical protein